MDERVKRIYEAADYIKERIENGKPLAGIVLGSGLGKLAEKIENVIDEIENSDVISEEPAEEIKNTLIEAQQFINDTHQKEECSACGVLREMIAVLNEDKDAKNKWIITSNGICFCF